VFLEIFHANATLRHRRNIITTLKTDNGETVTSHAEKETVIWNSFKQRIEQSEFSDMFFDLTSMIQRHEGLTHLEDQFSTAEIDEVVKKQSNDNSPGPIGFSNEFIKKCWPTIKMITIIFARLFRLVMSAFRVSNLPSSL
jgi:hypothetical protein